MSVVRTDENLWTDIKRKLKQKHGTWNARMSQVAVRQYKRLGGEYITPKPSKHPLNKWTSEKWVYALDDKEGRYLPQRVIDVAPLWLLEMENELKRQGGKGKKVPYSPELKTLMRQMGIF